MADVIRGARDAQLDRIAADLGDRSLLWFGIRGTDGSALLALPQLQHSFAITAPMGAASLQSDETMEELTRRRVDLDDYDIDLDPDPAVLEFRSRLLQRLSQHSAVATYRPSHFLSAAHFASYDSTRYLGMFKERHTAFEHKPWLETQVREHADVRTLDWQYVAEEHRSVLRDLLGEGPVVLRASHTSGGRGVFLLEHLDQLEDRWAPGPDALVAVAPYLSEALPVNVGAVVFADGTTTLHPATVQLIGVDACTNRRFGYCGNDRARFGELSPAVVAEVEEMTRRIGTWLGGERYVGAFGVDYLMDGETVYFGEVNARFQGSTALSVAVARESGRCDIVLDHLAASLGHEPTEQVGLVEWQAAPGPVSQVIVHNNSAGPVTVPEGASAELERTGWYAELLPEPDVQVDPGGVLVRLTVDSGVTRTGFDLIDDVRSAALATAAATVPTSRRSS